MNCILFDGPYREALLPFTYTRPVADLRIGITTIREKWELLLDTIPAIQTVPYLSKKFATDSEQKGSTIKICASIIPTAALVAAIYKLKVAEVLYYEDKVVAYCDAEIDSFSIERISQYTSFDYKDEKVLFVENTWDLFSLNDTVLRMDFENLIRNRKSAALSATNNVLNPSEVFVEEGANVEFAYLNATHGPIYIAKNAEIMEGSMIRGPFALGRHSTVKMGAKIYGATTIGPYCRVGGEINNSILFGYTNKGHEGYLGNSVLGEWCNLGADTNNSNLKNNYASVKLWNYQTENFAPTNLQFCGLMMGDHSKCGINTMFNTGTVVGVSANIFGSGFPRNFIPSFSWGGSRGFVPYLTAKAFEVVAVVMERRKITFTDSDKEILEHIFTVSKKWRGNK